VLIWITVAVLATAFAISVRLDARKFRAGVYLFGAVALAALAILFQILRVVQRRDPAAAGWTVIGVLLLGLAMVVVLGVLLVLAGLIVLRKERRTVANLLALLTGLLLLAFVAAGILAVAVDARVLIGVLVIAGFPAMYLGFGLTVFIGYGRLYRMLAARRHPAVGAVVVLGAGLRRTAVTPLLARRLDRGLVVYRRSEAAGRTPAIVVSGGQGPDELIPEAQAMAEYLLTRGLPPAAILREARSRNTRENLEFSRDLLRAAGVGGPVAVATSNYHAFRAALLMRHWGIDGFTVGAPTALYYWPTATIREYLAILRDHLVINLLALAVFCAPVLLLAIRSLIG
jgi:uncharacterized SAM-binding protein YcdF (DUF218 family)